MPDTRETTKAAGGPVGQPPARPTEPTEPQVLLTLVTPWGTLTISIVQMWTPPDAG